MARIDQQLEEDRALRDAANAVLRADMDILRNSMAPGDIAARLQASGEGLSAKALDMADRNRGALVAGSAVIAAFAALFFARKPISAKLDTLLGPVLGKSGSDAEIGEALALPPAADAPVEHREGDETLQIGQ